jgi:hypothetical protein
VRAGTRNALMISGLKGQDCEILATRDTHSDLLRSIVMLPSPIIASQYNFFIVVDLFFSLLYPK